MAIAPGVQRRDLHPDGPRGPHHTVHHRHRRAVPVHGQLPVHDDVAHRPAPAGNPVFDHERLQVHKAVGVDRPSRSFVDRQAYPAAPELNRRAGRDAQHDPLPGLEPLDCNAVVMASRDIVAGYATGGCDGVAAAVRRAAAPGSEAVLSEQMWRSRHAIANQALLTAGKLHPDKKIAKAARAALVKANSVRNSARSR